MDECKNCGSKGSPAWTVFLSIMSGWKNWAWSSLEIEQLAKQRAQICSSCDQLTMLNLFCNKCGCPIMPLIRNEFKGCDLDKWYPRKVNQNQNT